MTGNGTARRLLGGFFILSLLVVTGCAGPRQARDLDAAGGEWQAVMLDAVPFFSQEAYQCGPAALATLLNWTGAGVTPEALAPEVYLPGRKGSLQVELLAAARRHGRIPYVIQPQLEHLRRELAAGNPVLVLQNLGLKWLPRWHYAVVVGFDPRNRDLILRSGRMARRATRLPVFERTWRRGEYWGVVIAPPGRLPETAEEIPNLQAVLPLERLGQWQAAAKAYETALGRWPQSLGARMGLGNSLYAMGDFHGAELAYRQATQTHPQAAPAFNNLAQALADQGRWREAGQAARRAVALGGPMSAAYLETLEQILAQTPASVLPEPQGSSE